MLNQVILVGRLAQTPEVITTDSGKKMCNVTLAVPRSYKNQNGEYDTDFLDCILWTNVAENTAEYCKSGDIVGVKGRLQARLIENSDGTKYKRVEIIGEKITFLSSSKNNEEKKLDDTDESSKQKKKNNNQKD